MELKARTARSIADEEEMLELGADSPIESAQVYLKDDVDKVIAEKDKELCRHKYRRCLDMAYKCVVLCQKSKDLYHWTEDENLEHYYNHKIEFFARWNNRWLELAKKFKEEK